MYNAAATTADVLHPFERSGLGKAPFHYIGMEEKVCKVRDSIVAGGSCDHCSACIRYCFWIASSDGQRFKVGCDCVMKLDRADNVFVSKVEAEMKRVKLQASRERTALRKARERDRITNAAFGLLQDPMIAERFAAMPHPRGFTDRRTGRPLSLANYIDWMYRNAGHAGTLEVTKLIENTLGL